jgi:hypothetical protein
VTEPQRIVLPGVSDDDNRTLGRLLADLHHKQPRNNLRASYYDGKRAVRQVGTIIPPQYWRLGLVLGWTAKAVDVLARRCNFDRVFWPDGDLDSLGGSELFEGNNLKSRIHSALVSSLQHGPAFLVTTTGDQATGEPPALVHVKDALSAIGDWNARRQRLDNLLSVTGRDDQGQVNSLALYLDGVTITAEKDGSGWSVDVQDHPWGVPAEVMPYRPDERRPLGRSRISRPLMGFQDAGVRTLIRMEGHADVFTIPQMVMLGADESIFKNADGTPRPSWQVALGRVFGIPDDEDASNPRAQVQQFPAHSPEPHLAQLNATAKLFAREASLPDTAVAITDVSNPTSAESYDASQWELIAEAEGATDDWSPPLRRTIARALAIQNKDEGLPGALGSLGVKWRSPRFLSRAAQADAGQKQLAAVPWLAETEVGLELLGLDEQQIRRAMADRRRNGGSAALRTLAEANAARVVSGDGTTG